MGHESKTKASRRDLRKALGNDTTIWAMECFDVIKLRGFWGRMKWLFLGK